MRLVTYINAEGRSGRKGCRPSCGFMFIRLVAERETQRTEQAAVALVGDVGMSTDLRFSRGLLTSAAALLASGLGVFIYFKFNENLMK